MKMSARYILITLSLLVFRQPAFAQIESTDFDTHTEYTHGVVVYADPRLDIILKKQKSTVTGSIRSGQGYRVQIYNGNDRVKAMHIKNDFMRRFPNVKTYLSYVQPQFRVKVGDYKTRGDAEMMYEQTSALYNPCMIVPDIIMINTASNE